MTRWLLLLTPLVLLIACGNQVSETDGAGGASSSTSSSGSTGGGTSSTSGTAGAGACPIGEPAEGSSCDEEGLACEIEDGPMVVCRGYTTCTDGNWSGTWPGCSSVVDELPNCPASPPGADACTVSGSETGLCQYDDGTHCGCTNCLGGPCGGPTQWVCAPPPGGGCPPTAPRFGQVCSSSGIQCLYGSCSLGTQAQRDCLGGMWVDQQVMCPL